MKVLVTQSCLTLFDPMDCSPPGSSLHGILQARILEWVAIPFSRAFSWSRDWTWVSCITGRFFTIWATREWSHVQRCSPTIGSSLPDIVNEVIFLSRRQVKQYHSFLCPFSFLRWYFFPRNTAYLAHFSLLFLLERMFHPWQTSCPPDTFVPLYMARPAIP